MPNLCKIELKMEKGPISNFITHHYRHFNSAALVDAAKAYDEHMNKGGKMMLAMAGAMSTAEIGLSLAEMIRQDKIQIVSCSAVTAASIRSLLTTTTGFPTIGISLRHRRRSFSTTI